VVVEGQISDVVDYGDGNGTMTVMGIVIEIPEGVPIATPTAVLTMAQFADARSLPGRRQPGFVGAAAVVTGTSTKGQRYRQRCIRDTCPGYAHRPRHQQTALPGQRGLRAGSRRRPDAWGNR